MQKLKPKKGDPDYNNKIKAWRNALVFPKEMMHEVNDINNKIVLGGRPNTR